MRARRLGPPARTTPSPGCARPPPRRCRRWAPRCAELADTAAGDGVLVPERAACDVGALDRLCREHLLDGARAPAAAGARSCTACCKGFADLVFEHEGRYWVLDYKSNALGPGDAAYTQPRDGGRRWRAHRYDIQGAIYLLALHRLLRSRLGEDYDPARAAGRRGLPVPARDRATRRTRGCYLLEPDLALLDGLDRLLRQTA